MWSAVTSQRERGLYLALLALAVVLGGLAVAFADDAAQGLLAAAVTVGALALVWREAATRRGIARAEIQMISQASEVEVAGGVIGTPRSPDAKTVERGRVESWDEDTGWGVLSANLPNGGVFAHFSVVEGEGYRALKPGDAVSFDYVPAAGGHGSQDGCSYVAERVVQLED
jgi:cold shock protein